MPRPAGYRRILRCLAIAALTAPLLQSGTCLMAVERTLINGFFSAVTNVLRAPAAEAGAAAAMPDEP